MPELPEVETIARGLREGLVGRTVVAVAAQRDDQLRPSATEVVDALTGASIEAIDRYGKHLFVHLDSGRTLAVHLRMTGQLRLTPAEAPVLPHTHVVIHLDDGRQLRYRDVRRFGWLHAVPTERLRDDLPSLRGCGPDALAVDEATFATRLRATRRRLKALLLAQDIVCGVGNIYADEILWQARIHPLQRADLLSPARASRLWRAMHQTLLDAIAARGSSIDGEYVAPDGFAGGYQSRHAVYGREGRPAPCCGRPVRRVLVASRSTFHCPRCQRKVGP